MSAGQTAAPAAPDGAASSAASSRPGRLTPLLLLEIVTACAGIGNGITAIALPWLVLERTADAVAVGLVTAANSLPMILSAVLAGTIIGRWGSRRASIWSDLFSAVTMVAVVVISGHEALPIAALAFLAAAGSALDQIGVTARVAMLPAIARVTGLQRRQVNSLHEAVAAGAATVGPGLAGVIIGFAGVTSAFAVAAVLPAVAVAGMAVLGRLLGRDAGAPTITTGLFTSTVEGFRTLWRDRVIRLLLFMSFMFFALSLPIQSIVLPKHFLSQDAPEHLGLFVLVMSAGGLVGALAYGQWGAALRERTVFAASVTLSGVFFLLMSALPPTSVMLVLAGLTGIVAGPLTPICYTVMQRRLAEEQFGRAVGAFTASAAIAAPLGLTAGGFLVESLGVQPTFLICASIFLPLVLLAFGAPALRALDAVPERNRRDQQ